MRNIVLPAQSSQVNFAELLLVILVLFTQRAKIGIITPGSRRYENYVSCVCNYVTFLFWKTTACVLSVRLI